MPILYTIGHSKHPIEKFLGLLKLHGIKTLVDVRTNPMSRFNPQFNKKRLEESLANEEIEYVFAGEGLGGRPKNPGFYDESGVIVYERVAESKAFKDGLAQVVAMLDEKNVAVMCSEEDPQACHRKSLIGKALAGVPGITLRHIRGDGSSQDEMAL
jgi:uncharacterized protein (DUF488 family)